MPEYRKLQIEGIETEISFYGNAGALAEFQDLTGLGASEVSSAIASLNYGVIYSLMFQAYRVSMLRQKKEVSLSLQDLKLNVSGLKFIETATLVISDIFEDCGIKSVEKKTRQPIKK